MLASLRPKTLYYKFCNITQKSVRNIKPSNKSKITSALVWKAKLEIGKFFTMKKFINVVGAIIENDDREILCALRSTAMNLPNLWEFPGGKIDDGELEADALKREIKEELLCDIEVLSAFDDLTHEYEKFIVRLITYKCRLIDGIPTPTEHAKIVWLKRENLGALVWAPADIPTVNKLMTE